MPSDPTSSNARPPGRAPTTAALASRQSRLWIVIVPRKLVERALVELIERRAVQILDHGVEVSVDERHHARDVSDPAAQRAGQSLLDRLEGETADVVALQQVGRGVDAAGQVARVDADERVGRARVAAYAYDVGVFGGEDHEVGLEGISGKLVAKVRFTHHRSGFVVRVGRGATVPVLRNLLLATVPDVRAVWPGHGEERFQDIACQIPVDVVGGMVGHEIHDEMMSDWRNESRKRLIGLSFARPADLWLTAWKK